MLTVNIKQMREEIETHIKNDQLVSGQYWSGGRGCFIGCLTHSSDPTPAVERFGLTLPILRIAENIFEAMPYDEGREFFAEFGESVAVDGKDLSRVHWRFLAEELRALPKMEKYIQETIDPIIYGLESLAVGKKWYAAAAYAARAARAAARAAYAAADAAYAADAAAYAAHSARAARAAYAAAYAAHSADADAYAARAARAAYAAADADAAAYAARAARAAARKRQASTLLQIIRETPVESAKK